jgi:hypothetical protein
VASGEGIADSMRECITLHILGGSASSSLASSQNHCQIRPVYGDEIAYLGSIAPKSSLTIKTMDLRGFEG